MIEGAEHQQGERSYYRERHDNFLRHVLFRRLPHLLAPLKEFRVFERKVDSDRVR
jgi:hypothetical protein